MKDKREESLEERMVKVEKHSLNLSAIIPIALVAFIGLVNDFTNRNDYVRNPTEREVTERRDAIDNAYQVQGEVYLSASRIASGIERTYSNDARLQGEEIGRGLANSGLDMLYEIRNDASSQGFYLGLRTGYFSRNTALCMVDESCADINTATICD